MPPCDTYTLYIPWLMVLDCLLENKKCESANLDFIKDVDPMLQLLVKKEDLVVPDEVRFLQSQSTSKYGKFKQDQSQYQGQQQHHHYQHHHLHQSLKQSDQYFQMSAPFTLKPSNYANYSSRQRSQSSEFRPPHDFSNPIWEYFTLEEDKATCKVCGKRITYRNNAYVTNLVTHLRTRGIGHDTSYNFYMMKKSETSNKIREEMALNYLLTNMASTVFGQNQQNSGGGPGAE
ncbi:hypothetical protein RUM44_009665 [Polyplax serrata]|uniref:BED-type domain-containing protein n=1 Tax=Polyplax serrata TaxID=468196 RepID=A0ABR1AUT3_POLSC